MCKGNGSPVSGEEKKNSTASYDWLQSVPAPNYEEESVKRSLVMRNLVNIPSGSNLIVTIVLHTKKIRLTKNLSHSKLPPGVGFSARVPTTVKLDPLHKIMDHLAGVSSRLVVLDPRVFSLFGF